MSLLDNAVFDLPLYSLKNIECDGRITAIYDGDTLTVVLDIEGIYEKHKIRMYGINAPELKGITHKEGLISRNYLISLILGKDLELEKEYTNKEINDMLKELKKTFRFKLLGEDKYGRILGEIYNDKECINDLMVLNGYAEVYMV